MSKILNIVFGIIGSAIAGCFVGAWFALTYVGCDLYLNGSNELSDDTATVARLLADTTVDLFHH